MTDLKQNRKHRIFTRIAAVLAAVAITASAQASDMENEIPKILTLNAQPILTGTPDLPKDKKQVLSFSHQEHAFTYLKQIVDPSKGFKDDFTCIACHPNASTPEEIISVPAGQRLTTALKEKGGAKKLKKFFHDICLSCHKSLKKAAQKTGPTSCKGCHNRT